MLEKTYIALGVIVIGLIIAPYIWRLLRGNRHDR